LIRFAAKVSKHLEPLRMNEAKNRIFHVYLHNPGLGKMTTSPLYDDATVLHGWDKS
jgi:hypothetical protein